MSLAAMRKAARAPGGAGASTAGVLGDKDDKGRKLYHV